MLNASLISSTAANKNEMKLQTPEGEQTFPSRQGQESDQALDAEESMSFRSNGWSPRPNRSRKRR